MEKFVLLNNGVKMPFIGFGTYKMPSSITERTVSDALKSGYRHIDTAQCYGIETHVFRQQRPMAKLLKAYGTVHESWSPLAAGKENIFVHPILLAIAEAHKKTAAQIALRFLFQREIPIIPKTTHIERMKENMDIWDFSLSDEEMNDIGKLDKGKSLFSWW